MPYGIRIFLFAAALILFTRPFSPPVFAILDSESMDCLGCHDAIFASDAPVEFCPLPECPHPVGVDYISAAFRNPSLVPPNLLNPAIRLPGGILGCGACHIPFDDRHLDAAAARKLAKNSIPPAPDPMLVTDNRRSELCLSCHLK